MDGRLGLLITNLIALAAVAASSLTVAAARAGEDPAPSSAPAPSFETDIQPLLRRSCSRCHGEKNRKADLDVGAAATLKKGGESGPAIVPGKPEESLLYEKIHEGAMPPDEKDRLSDAEIALIRRWIVGGAKSNAADAPQSADELAATVTQHDVIPILLRHCTVCHGLHRQEAGLDLRTKASLLKGGKSGPAIVTGKPAESLLVQKIRAGQMPPNERLVEASVKPIEKGEAELIEKWIAAGAPEAAIAPDVATTDLDPLVTDKDRDFWAFRPPQAAAVPAVERVAQVRNPIDAFLLAKLERKGLALSPEADRSTLVRRASFDLTGLPPEPAEVEAFLGDTAPDAYEQMIDRLLASPRYGERWGRFWLDLAGYADSEGKREQDLPRPYAWRYRDYVIRALNADKPYDRFLLEQLAGDELADYEHVPKITAEICDNLTATAFLKMAPDATWANITGYLPDRLEVIADEIDVLGSAVMGLTLKCARCHSHKFDPLPQRDYYRLLDVFKGAYDEHNWLKPDVRPGIGPVSQDALGGRHLPYVTSAERLAWQEHNARVESELQLLRSALDQKEQAFAAMHFEKRLAELPEVLRADVRTALSTAADKRDVVQRYLAEKFEKQLRPGRDGLKAADASFKKEVEEAEAKIKLLEAQRQPEPRIQALWDRGNPSPTYIYRRGNPLTPGRLVGPGVPSVLSDGKTPFVVEPPWPGAKSTGRRLAFARWLVRPDHPLTARVMVNRIWKHHFGTGIVKSLANFGKAGEAPTHPELLDWLAIEFVRRGWSLKAMHRLMMTSAAYRQSSLVATEHESLDPDNSLYSRMPLVRLDAESLYDAMLAVAAKLDETRFGPADPIDSRADGLVTPIATPRGWRRMIYVEQTRKRLPTHLENFDYPQMNPNCIERRDSTVATQALELMNNGMVHELAQSFAARILREAGDDRTRQIERAYLVALGRAPSEEEQRTAADGLARLTAQWARQQGAAAQPTAGEASRCAVATFCHAMLNSAAFLYVD